MSDVIVSPNMNLPVPVVSSDTGPDWANNLNSCLGAIDSHDHTSGSGVPITPDALNINASLPMGNNQLTQTQAVVFQAQASLATLKAAYVISNDLYYNDGAGNVVRITQSGSVAGATGTITGLPSGTASASYQSVGGTFQFQSATNTPANISGATVKISEQTTSPNFISLKSPASLASAYDFTYPAAPPAATAFLTISSAGATGTSIPISLGIDTANIANSAVTAVKIASDAVTTVKILDSNVTTAKIADAAVTSAKLDTDLDFTGSPTIGGNKVAAGASFTNNIKIYSGRVNSDGTIAEGNGFTVARNSAGVYTITFDSGSPNKPVVVATPGGGSASLTTQTDNEQTTPSARVTFRNLSTSATDANFHFIGVVFQ